MPDANQGVGREQAKLGNQKQKASSTESLNNRRTGISALKFDQRSDAGSKRIVRLYTEGN